MRNIIITCSTSLFLPLPNTFSFYFHFIFMFFIFYFFKSIFNFFSISFFFLFFLSFSSSSLVLASHQPQRRSATIHRPTQALLTWWSQTRALPDLANWARLELHPRSPKVSKALMTSSKAQVSPSSLDIARLEFINRKRAWLCQIKWGEASLESSEVEPHQPGARLELINGQSPVVTIANDWPWPRPRKKKKWKKIKKLKN